MILGAHPQITYYDENGPYPIAVFRRREYSHRTPHVGLKLTTLTPEATKFKREYPEMKFIFLTRGILSTCSSMLKLDWVKPLILGEELQKSINNLYPSDYKTWVISKFLEFNYSQSAHQLAALYAQVRFNWLYEYDACSLACKHVNYERLITNPETIIRQLADFLGIAFNPRMLEHDKLFRGLTIHGTKGDRRIDVQSVTKYNGHLERSHVIDILDVATQTQEMGICYYASFAQYAHQVKTSDAIEKYCAESSTAPRDVSAANRDPFKFAKAAAALTEREKVIVYLHETGANLDAISERIHADSESAKVEIAALLQKNEELDKYYRESGCFTKTMKRYHLIDF
jgi:hypothetical protein